MVTTDAFTKIASLTQPVRLVCGGTSAGKTYSIIQYLIIYGFKRELTINIVALTSRMLEQGSYKIFIKLLKELGYYDPNNHNLTQKSYKLNNTTFNFFTAENPDTLIGIRGDITFLNEANKIPFESYTQLESRTDLFTICDWNPASIFWADENLIGEDGVDFIRLTYKDNNQLSEKIIQGIESWKEKGKTSKYYANKWLVYGLGMLGKQEGAIYTDWDIIDELPENSLLLGSSLDWGFADDPAALLSVYRYNGELIIDEVIYETKLTNPMLANKIKKTDAKNAIIYADSSEPKSIAELKHYGLTMLGVTKGAGSINYGIQLVQQQPFKVTSRSLNLIKELQNYIWLVDRDGNFLDKPLGKNDHLCDCLRYFFMMQFGTKKTTFSLKWKR